MSHIVWVLSHWFVMGCIDPKLGVIPQPYIPQPEPSGEGVWPAPPDSGYLACALPVLDPETMRLSHMQLQSVEWGAAGHEHLATADQRSDMGSGPWTTERSRRPWSQEA